MALDTQIIAVAYAAVNIIAIIAYFPTIKDLYVRKKPSANFQSYVLWTLGSFISVLYSLFVLPDLLFRIVSFLFFFANLAVMLLLLRMRLNKKP